MATFEEHLRVDLEAFRQVCVNKTFGPGFEQTVASLVEAHNADLEAFAERIKAKACGRCAGTGWALEHPQGVPFSQSLAAMSGCPDCGGTGIIPDDANNPSDKSN